VSAGVDLDERAGPKQVERGGEVRSGSNGRMREDSLQTGHVRTRTYCLLNRGGPLLRRCAPGVEPCTRSGGVLVLATKWLQQTAGASFPSCPFHL
jgi:hypothetical protein